MTQPDLPAARRPDRPYAIGLICLGNICRSPTAEVVLAARVDEAGLGDRVRLTSVGTGTWHLDEAMDERAATVLRAAGYDPSAHRARRIDDGWLSEQDLLLAMDHRNHADVAALLADDPEARGRLRMFRHFDPAAPEPDAEVPDPFFGAEGGFDAVLVVVERTAEALAERLAAEHGLND